MPIRTSSSKASLRPPPGVQRTRLGRNATYQQVVYIYLTALARHVMVTIWLHFIFNLCSLRIAACQREYSMLVLSPMYRPAVL